MENFIKRVKLSSKKTLWYSLIITLILSMIFTLFYAINTWTLGSGNTVNNAEITMNQLANSTLKNSLQKTETKNEIKKLKSKSFWNKIESHLFQKRFFNVFKISFLTIFVLVFLLTFIHFWEKSKYQDLGGLY